LDGGFATPAIFDLLEAARVEYVVAKAKNAVLLAAAAKALTDARREAEATGASARVFTETRWADRSAAQSATGAEWISCATSRALSASGRSTAATMRRWTTEKAHQPCPWSSGWISGGDGRAGRCGGAGSMRPS
jgi:hypothetical protein